jgi:hypothetical protein
MAFFGREIQVMPLARGSGERVLARRATGTVERLAVANGWQVASHQGQDYVVRDPAARLGCDIHIHHLEGAPIFLIRTGLAKAVSALALPAGLFAGLMARPHLFGSWQTEMNGSAHLRFILAYTALTGGLTPGQFGDICRVMAGEVAELDRVLHQQGLL